MAHSEERSRGGRVIVVIDCEFCCLPWTDQRPPLWIGLARHDSFGSRQWSAFNTDAPIGTLTEFSRENVLPKVPADEVRLDSEGLSTQIQEFCEGVTEFWAWCPTISNLVNVFGLGNEEAAATHAAHWDHDLTLLKRLIDPWPTTWPSELNDLHARVREEGVELPVNPNPHHPGVDATWGLHVLERTGDI